VKTKNNYAGGAKMKATTVSRVLMVAIAVVFMSVMVGCSGLDIRPEKRGPYLLVHTPLVDADRALDEARMAGKDKQCPQEFNALKDQVDKAYEVYLACHTQEGIDMANDATRKIKALCPAYAEPAPVIVPEADTDGDGVIDKLDQCPDTPHGVKVDEVGCPIDSDKDGVPDYLDKCPNTPMDLKVDKDGCPMKVTINLDVLFDFDKSDIKAKYHNELKRAADYMIAYPWEKATLEGHTDSRGTDAYNQKLSQRRVDAVKKYLVEKFGISADRLTAVGYGKSRPIATNDTDEGRQLNRRVQAVMETYIRR
jgi:outer membrane protein OmpA-like peptidoglycan-associated protein